MQESLDSHCGSSMTTISASKGDSSTQKESIFCIVHSSNMFLSASVNSLLQRTVSLDLRVRLPDLLVLSAKALTPGFSRFCRTL